jgi:subtilisin family serine protease
MDHRLRPLFVAVAVAASGLAVPGAEALASDTADIGEMPDAPEPGWGDDDDSQVSTASTASYEPMRGRKKRAPAPPPRSKNARASAPAPAPAAPAPAPVSPAPAPPPLPSSAETQFSRQALQVKANAAWIQGANGHGVVVALLDTGLQFSHAEFAGAGKIVGTYNAVNGGRDVTDVNGHGTHVAGIVAANADANGTVGVAWGSRLLAIKVFDDQSRGKSSWMDAGLRYATGRASIANLSLGGGAGDPTALRGAVTSGLLVVAAAGNDGGANPIWPARYAKESWANGRIIAVGAVDSNNVIAPWSNRAGDTANFYLVAPGVGVYSTYRDGYAAMSGTSMATPVVTGAAAVVKSRWPHLTADRVAGILLSTATDLGAPGIDVVYGRGLLNLEQAMQPIGTLTARAASGQTSVLAQGNLVASSAMSALAKAGATGQLKIKALDAIGRAYDVDLGAKIRAAPTPLSLDALMSHAAWQAGFAERTTQGGARIALLEPTWSPDGRAAGSPSAMWVQPLSTDGRLELATANGRLSGHYFGLQGSVIDGMPSMVGVRSLDNPYLGLSEGGLQFAAGMRLDGLSLRAGVVSASNAPLDRSAQRAMPATASVFELTGRIGSALIATTWTHIDESSSWLGSTSGGALALGAARTDAVQWSGALPVGERTVLTARWATGTTRTAAAPGLAESVSATRTESFAVGAMWSDVHHDGDRLGLTLSQPMRATSGRVTYNLPVEQLDDGTLRYEKRVVYLAPRGRETLLQSDYAVPLRGLALLQWSAGVRLQPGHDRSAPAQGIVGVRYQVAF